MLQLTPRQQGYALAGAGVVALVGSVFALWPVDPRRLVTDAATEELGKDDPKRYWRDVLPFGTPPSSYPKDWCGGFALWALHQAGLALDLGWVIGLGFLGNLPITSRPEPGDIAYFDKNQHHAVVTDVDLIGDRVGLVNGNGTGGEVTYSVQPRSDAKAYYSIAPLLSAARARSQGNARWLLGGALLAAGASWAILPSR